MLFKYEKLSNAVITTDFLFFTLFSLFCYLNMKVTDTILNFMHEKNALIHAFSYEMRSLQEMIRSAQNTYLFQVKIEILICTCKLK